VSTIVTALMDVYVGAGIFWALLVMLTAVCGGAWSIALGSHTLRLSTPGLIPRWRPGGAIRASPPPASHTSKKS
jgi:hypothetical protein